ncbi:TonB C-terminal domain-containing protein [Prosthecobacter sp.]|uniref:TonB C-terminal domain-containing protein n=1 Tax=Prosthecobacter sp. TaxID=1965333 RepID=UPI0037842C7E
MKRRRPTTLEPISAAAIVIVSLHLAAGFGVWWWWQNTQNSKRATQQMRLAWMNPADFKDVAPAPTPPKAKPVAAAPKLVKKAPDEAPKPPPAPAEAPVQKATLVAAPPQQHAMEPVPNPAAAPLFAPSSPAAKPSANRSITLRRAHEKRSVDTFGPPVPPMTNPKLMDMARLNALRPAAIPPAPNTPGATAETEEDVNLDAVDEAVNAAFLSSWVSPSLESVPEGQREARLRISIGKDGTLIKVQMNKFSGSHALDQSILEAAAKVKKISTTLPSNFSKDSYDLEMNFLLLP